MAQSHRTAAHSGGGGGAFYLDQKLIVQLPLSEEAPEGGVVALEPGWYDSENLDPRVATNPIVMRLIPHDGAAAARLAARAAMNRKINNGEAQPGEMQAMLQEQAAQMTEEQKAAAEDWTARAQAAYDKGAPFSDPHPDPAVTIARSMTQSAPQYVASGGFQSKIMDTPTSPMPTNAPRPALRPADPAATSGV